MNDDDGMVKNVHEFMDKMEKDKNGTILSSKMIRMEMCKMYPEYNDIQSKLKQMIQIVLDERNDPMYSIQKSMKMKCSDQLWKNGHMILEKSVHFNLWNGPRRQTAVSVGMQRLYQWMDNVDYRKKYAVSVISYFKRIADVSKERINVRAKYYAYHTLQRWLSDLDRDGWDNIVLENGPHHVKQLLEVMNMVAVVREMNVFHPLQEKLEQFMMNGFTMSPEEILGWNAVENEPPAEHHAYTPERLLLAALTRLHTAHRIQLGLGVPFATVYKWTSFFYPYKGPTLLPWHQYIDQCFLATRIVQLLSNHGKLRVSPVWLPHEHTFIMENMAVAIASAHVLLVAEFVQALTSFGERSQSGPLKRGIIFLLNTQNSSSGRWNTADGSVELTIAATLALVPHSPSGFGPFPTTVQSVLEQHVDAAQRMKTGSVKMIDFKSDQRKDALKNAQEQLLQSRAFKDSMVPQPATVKSKVQELGTVSHTIASIQAKLEANNLDAKNILGLLQNLNTLKVSFELLKESKIGKSVAALRKHDNEQVRVCAKVLVKKWKDSYVNA